MVTIRKGASTNLIVIKIIIEITTTRTTIIATVTLIVTVIMETTIPMSIVIKERETVVTITDVLNSRDRSSIGPEIKFTSQVT